jgi:hypothetical protein
MNCTKSDRQKFLSQNQSGAWQNQTDSKNRTDFGFSCKQGVMVLLTNIADVNNPLAIIS